MCAVEEIENRVKSPLGLQISHKSDSSSRGYPVLDISEIILAYIVIIKMLKDLVKKLQIDVEDGKFQ